MRPTIIVPATAQSCHSASTRLWQQRAAPQKNQSLQRYKARLLLFCVPDGARTLRAGGGAAACVHGIGTTDALRHPAIIARCRPGLNRRSV